LYQFYSDHGISRSANQDQDISNNNIQDQDINSKIIQNQDFSTSTTQYQIISTNTIQDQAIKTLYISNNLFYLEIWSYHTILPDYILETCIIWIPETHRYYICSDLYTAI